MPIRAPKTSGGIGFQGGMNSVLNPYLRGNNEEIFHIDGFDFIEQGSLRKVMGFSTEIGQDPMTQLAEPFTGIYEFSKASGQNIEIATAPSKVYVRNGGNWDTLVSGRLSTVDNHADFETLADQAIIVNGVDANLKTSDGIGFFNLGIAAPTLPLNAADGGAGVLSGIYEYVVTFVNVLGQESNPSPLGTVALGAARQVTLTAIPVSADPQITLRRIYRTTTGGGIHLFLTEIPGNVTTTFPDNIADSSLGIAVEQLAFGVLPVAAKFVHVQDGRLWAAGAQSSRLYFSARGLPGSFHPADFRDIGPEDGEVITGISSLDGSLVVFKGASIWVGVGREREDIELVRRVHSVGTVARHSIARIPGNDVLMFLSRRGFYSFNGISETYMSYPIEPTIDALNQSRSQFVHGAVDLENHTYIAIMSTGSETQNDMQVRFDFRQKKWSLRGIPNTRANVIAKGGIQFGGKDLFYMGGHDGQTLKGNTTFSDLGAPIKASVTFRSHPETPSSDMKGFSSIISFFKPDPFPGAQKIKIFAAIDHLDAPFELLDTIDVGEVSQGQATISFSILAIRLYVKIENDEIIAPIELRGLEVGYRNMGRVI